LVFPLQVVINLSEPGVDHTGGEFLLVEQRPRAQSRGTATLIPQGHGLVFTTRDRPVRSTRGWSASPVRHGVSPIHTGRRHTLGLVFHDAKKRRTPLRADCSIGRLRRRARSSARSGAPAKGEPSPCSEPNRGAQPEPAPPRLTGR
jgi:hypothetical protein